MLAPALGASATHERFRQRSDDEQSLEELDLEPPGSQVDDYIGTTIDGRYVVESVLGEGGMGVVYKCRRKVFDKAVAVKILRADLARNPEVLDRFVTEAKAASAIGSPHIVNVFDFGEVPDGSTYFAMEYLEGDTLGAAMSSGTLDTDRAVRIGRQIANGLAAAHASNIVHRDLKPDNFIITSQDGQDFVKILDFGIAKVVGLENKITRAGAVFGTPHYMSPEQCRGSSVDYRTDVYSIGVILYEMLTGSVPFDAENPLTILSMHLNEPPERFADRDPPVAARSGLESVVLKCLAKAPEDRFQSMIEVEAALAAIERGESVEIDVPISVAPPPDQYEIPAVVPPAAGMPAFGPRELAPPSVPQSGSVRRVTPADESGRPSFVGDVRASMPGVERPPLSARDVDPVEMRLRAAAEEAEADREWAKSSTRRWPLYVASVVGVAALAGGIITYASLQVSTLGEAFQPARPLLFNTSIANPAESEAALSVALVLAPIDAHVYRDGRDLGSMPVEIQVKKGESVEVEVRRDGYHSRKLTLDGTKPTLTVRLAALGNLPERPGKPRRAAPGPSGAPPPAPAPVEPDPE